MAILGRGQPFTPKFNRMMFFPVAHSQNITVASSIVSTLIRNINIPLSAASSISLSVTKQISLAAKTSSINIVFSFAKNISKEFAVTSSIVSSLNKAISIFRSFTSSVSALVTIPTGASQVIAASSAIILSTSRSTTKFILLSSSVVLNLPKTITKTLSSVINSIVEQLIVFWPHTTNVPGYATSSLSPAGVGPANTLAHYTEQSEIIINGNFYVSGTLTDPSSLKIYVKDPTGTITVHTLSSGDGFIVKDSTGKYHAVVTGNLAGPWFYRWESGGACTAFTESEFFIDPSQFYPT